MSDHKDKLTSQTAAPGMFLKVIVPAVIIIVTVAAAFFMVRTKPKPESRVRGERAAVVNTLEMQRCEEQVVVRTTGTVVPSREIELKPRVSGEIIWADPRFIPGGRFEKGEVILKLDPLDYQIALTNRAADLAKAEFDFKTEQGLQNIAGYEWDAMQKMDANKKFSELERELSLREPHLHLAESNLRAAEARLRQAEVNLDRATVRAPFNCMVRARNVNIGSQVTLQTSLAEITSTDSVWVMATIPVSALKWIQAADETGGSGSRAAVSSVPGLDMDAEWEGHVLRKMIDLEKQGRQAQLIIEIPSPDNTVSGKGGILFGAYVRLSLEGVMIRDVYKIPGAALHDGSRIWVMSPEQRLDIRDVEIKWAGRDSVFISSGVDNGDKLVISNLGTPIKGMLLQEVPERL